MGPTCTKILFIVFLLGGLEEGTRYDGKWAERIILGDENVLNMDGGGSLTVNLLKTVAFYT